MNAVVLSALFAWWLAIVGLALTGNRGAQWSNIVLLVVWGLYLNGFTGLFSTLPPNAYPYHSIAHAGSFISGAIAAGDSWRLRAKGGTLSWALPVITLALVLGWFFVGMGLSNT